MNAVKNDEIRQTVRQQYGQVANNDAVGCGCGTTCCDTPTVSAEARSQGLGIPLMMSGPCPKGQTWGLAVAIPRP